MFTNTPQARMSDSAPTKTRDARRRLEQLIDEQIAERSDQLYVHQRRNIEGLAETALSAGLEKSQMNKLERFALSASTFGAIADYAKSQTGRDTAVGETWADSGFGPDLLNGLNKGIQPVSEDAEALLSALDDRLRDALQQEGESDEETQTRLHREVSRRLRVGYARALIEHVVAHYSYEASLAEN